MFLVSVCDGYRFAIDMTLVHLKDISFSGVIFLGGCVMNAKMNVKKLTIIGMLSAIAFVVMVVGRIPVVMFYKYDPKDVIIAIGGFIYGPMTSFFMSAIVSLIEMFTVSDTGPIGLLMNVLASCSFACTAAYIYKKKHTMKGAVIGLASGIVAMTAVMLLWNYLITPIYMNYPREAVAELLLPVILPFNLLKATINSAIAILLYKPLVTVLRKTGMVEPAAEKVGVKKYIGPALVAAIVLATCIFLAVVLGNSR